MLIGLGAGALLSLPLSFLSGASPQWMLLTLAAKVISAICMLGALVILRRGQFKLAILIATFGLLLGISIVLLQTGLGASVVLALMIPITLAGLLAGRRALLIITGLSLASVAGVALLGTFRAPLATTPAQPLLPTMLEIVVDFLVLLFVLDRFGASLQDVLAGSLKREQQLEQLRSSLETKVSERTASLQEILQTVEQREARLAQTLEDLRSSQEAVRELSAPVIPVLSGVLVAPLIGNLDHERTQVLMENVLKALDHQQVQYVIFDATGMPTLDVQAAQGILQTAAAIRLLGAQTLLVGVRPDVAQTLVALHIDLSAVQTYADLHAAVVSLLPTHQSNGAANRAGEYQLA
ncbi:MAG: STAS domain-containing protein [Chloroflexi bacterium]|nr:STAS domain-containing protein [Chloroflexota bacterium]